MRVLNFMLCSILCNDVLVVRYPTLVIRGTGLYELWKTGRYKSYPPSVLVDLVARILALVPPWTRVYVATRYVFKIPFFNIVYPFRVLVAFLGLSITMDLVPMPSFFLSFYRGPV